MLAYQQGRSCNIQCTEQNDRVLRSVFLSYQAPDEIQYKEPQTAEPKPAENPESRTPPRRANKASSVQKNKEGIYRGTGAHRLILVQHSF